jgi:O-antigen/teichoic acid export membrane protein
VKSAPGHERLQLERIPDATGSLVLASLPLMVMSLLELAVLNLDPVVLGLRLPAAVVGAAGLAILAAFFVSRQLADAAGRAVYPTLVRYRDQPARAFDVFRVATLFLLTLVVPIAFFVFWNAERVVMILTLGRSDWLAAADYLRVAAFVPLARPLTMFGRELLLVYHRDRLLIGYTLANLLALGGLGYALVGTDLRELGMAIAGYFPLGMLLLAWGLWQLERDSFKRLLRDIGGLYLLGLALFAPIALVPEPATWWRFWLSAGAAVIFVVAALRLHRDLYRAFLAFD